MTSSSDMISIHDLMRAVRAHPDYVFGTVFVKDDFPGGVVAWEASPREASRKSDVPAMTLIK